MSQFLRWSLFLFCLSVPAAWGADHCVVLQYRHVSDTQPGIVSVTPEQFQRHLDYLLANDHAVLPLEEVVAALQTGTALPDRCVALTLDGGHASAYDEAFPRLRRYAYPLTVFVSTGVVDEGRDGYLNWDQMREMQRDGVRFQSLGHAHQHLIRRAPDETPDDWQGRIAVDIQLAQNRLMDELGSRPTLFAYPYGEYNEALKTLVGSMGLTAFGLQSGPVWREADFTALPRFAMGSLSARMRAFEKKVTSLPLPITGAFPLEPVVEVDAWQPSLTIVFKPGVVDARALTCYLNGSPEMVYEWLEQPAGAVVVASRGRLNVGRNRTDCTLPVAGGRLGWFGHVWIRREADGGWYPEPRYLQLH